MIGNCIPLLRVAEWTDPVPPEDIEKIRLTG